MIVDTSAIMAIILGEPEADRLLRAMGDATVVEMSAATYVECGIVIDRLERKEGNPIRFVLIP